MAKTFSSSTARKFLSKDTEEDTAKYIAPENIQTAEPFKSLFAINEDVYAAILTSMQTNGYDESQPVILWKEKNLLIDGHTRHKAAIETDQKQIPYIEKSFANEEEALEYMYRIQFHRRNITDGELLPLAQTALQKYEKKYGAGSKAEFLTKRFAGLSLAKAKRLAVVIEEAGNGNIQDIIEGKKTIYETYANINDSKKDKNSPKQKVRSNFLNETDLVSNKKKIKEPKEQAFVKELFLNEGNIYYTSELGKAKEIVISVAPSFHNEEMLREILEVVKKYMVVEK